MKRIFILIISILSSWNAALAQAPTVLIQPKYPVQGEAIMISLPGVSNLSRIKSVFFDSQVIPVFLHDEHPAALYGIDLNAKPGKHMITVSLSDGNTITHAVDVKAREKEIVPLGIPEKLGGNTATSQMNLAISLEKENRLLKNIITHKKKLWTEDFILPVANPIVVDSYGYTRKTGSYAIAHKGTDFRAVTGTPIRSMNRGVVRLARHSPIYGNTVVVDHGMGLMTFYMHLSKMAVEAGQLVQRGQIIGSSGETGYATGPHLHLSLRLNTTSVDPMKFMELFK